MNAPVYINPPNLKPILPPCHQLPAIVLVAFGTSMDSARKVFDFIDAQARQRYPEHELQWAFTSSFIIDKLKRRGIITRTVAEVVAELRSRGFQRIVFQSMYVVPGQEHRAVLAIDTTGLQVAYGGALLTSATDIEATITALALDIDPTAATVIVAHGNTKHSECSRQLKAFVAAIEAHFPHLVVASIEGTPGSAGLEVLRRRKPQAVNFVPLMLVGENHLMNDVLGAKENSWKNILQAPQTRCSNALGWNKAILKIYFDHLDRALDSLMTARS
ncbi:MAG: sirohydrochlorin cobaltochelatase [Desulfuromonadaceae bacterium]|nr:sirohydrochlorin cobaltochelatase [Desulfuromonadaceae bacterium]